MRKSRFRCTRRSALRSSPPSRRSVRRWWRTRSASNLGVCSLPGPDAHLTLRRGPTSTWHACSPSWSRRKFPWSGSAIFTLANGGPTRQAPSIRKLQGSGVKYLPSGYSCAQGCEGHSSTLGSFALFQTWDQDVAIGGHCKQTDDEGEHLRSAMALG